MRLCRSTDGEAAPARALTRAEALESLIVPAPPQSFDGRDRVRQLLSPDDTDVPRRNRLSRS
jgi:hypothetical protein